MRHMLSKAHALVMASLTGFAALASTAAWAGKTSAEQTPNKPADSALLIALIILPFALVGVRWLVLWRLRKLMMKASDEGAGTKSTWAKKNEVQAAQALSVQEVDAGQMPAEADAVRERWVASALATFRKLAYTDAAVAAGYLLLPLLFGTIGGSYRGTGWDGTNYALVALLIAAARHGAYSDQFRAHGAEGKGLIGGLAHLIRHGSLRASAEADAPRPLWRRVLGWLTWPIRFLAREIITRYGMIAHELYQLLSPRVRIVISAMFIVYVLGDGLSILVDSGIHKAVGAGLVAAALLHAAAVLGLWLRTRSQAGARLLVLRVFDIDENATFTFGGVLAFWRHFGNYFTVIDRSIWRHDLRLMSRPGFVVLAGSVIVVIASRTVFEDLFKLGDDATAMAMVGLPLLAAVIGAAWALRWLDKSCIRSREHLLQGLKRLERQPRGIDLGYKPMQVSCHDNTWRVAVDEFARRADAVMMDLRGISASNQGCADEVDFLFDTVPLHKIVFIVDAGTDQALVHNLLVDRWQMLDVASPNLKSRAPCVRLYVAHVQDPLDIQCILDLLMLAADSRGVPALSQQPQPAGAAAAAT